MASPTHLSGFPEWDPAGRVIERALLDIVARTFQLHGYAEIATRAIEPVSELLAKGETSKEIYLLSRLQDEAGAERTLGLHFDLTVPFARYVRQNAATLTFPFKRYQIQPAWRGERPQDGRFREFVQADIDVVAPVNLPAHFEVEMPVVVAEVLARTSAVGVPPGRIGVNNRQLAEGIYRALGMEDIAATLAAVDKLAKIGPEKVMQILGEQGASAAAAGAAVELASLDTGGGVEQAVNAYLSRHGLQSELARTGLERLVTVVEGARAEVGEVVHANLAIARGLDYYTGSVYETVLTGHEGLGSVGGGGRYDNLVNVGATSYPGVGMSIGISRIMSRVLGAKLARASRPVPTAVLVAVNEESQRAQSRQVARALRARGIPTDVAPKADKFGKQIRHADRFGIPYVWFLTDAGHEVKDVRTGEQLSADPQTWTPPAADLWPRAIAPQ